MIKQGRGYYWFGALKNVYMEAAGYISAVQFAIICIVAYTTTAAPWFYSRGIEVPFWLVIVLFLTLITSVLVFTYIIGIPSHYLFLEKQFKRYGNFTASDMQKILSNQRRIMKQLNMETDDEC